MFGSKSDFARDKDNQVSIIEQAVNILREDLVSSLWMDYGIKVEDPEAYVEYAIDSLLEEVWFEGKNFYQLDELGDISSTDFASWVETFDLEDYFAAGTVDNENVEVFDYEDVGPKENLRRAYSSTVREQPMRIIREGIEEKFGVDVLNEDTEIVVDMA